MKPSLSLTLLAALCVACFSSPIAVAAGPSTESSNRPGAALGDNAADSADESGAPKRLRVERAVRPHQAVPDSSRLTDEGGIKSAPAANPGRTQGQEDVRERGSVFQPDRAADDPGVKSPGAVSPRYRESID